MHPSKIHQSTTKPTGLLSSHPVNDVSRSPPSKPTIATVAQDTPSKSRVSLPNHMNSPTFDFSFERPESDLSAEAQKIMDSVREEAAKIKAQMIEERNKQDHNDGEMDQLYGVGGRKIAKPKGKSGRFSDVHKQEFKKMDSIANHASAWKSNMQSNAQSLKRSPSKAELDETTPKSMTKSKSMRSLHFNTSDGKMENTSPGKRARRDYGDDASSARPVSRDTDDNVQNIPGKPRPSFNLPSAVTTPTKASLARSASVKSMKTSMIPSLSRSASTKTLSGPSAPKTEGSNKYANSLSRFSGSMKSILHRAQPKFSDDPTKVAAGTHLPLPKANLDLEKDLPSLPGSPSKDTFQQSPTIKRVGFADNKIHKLIASPSLSKIPTPLARYQQQNPPPSPPKADSDSNITYPLLATSPNITTRRPIPKPTTPGDFTFRANKAITFSPSLSKVMSVNSPGGTTIRHVRPSGLPTPLGMPGAWEELPSIPHGMSNKKRKHGTLDGEGDMVMGNSCSELDVTGLNEAKDEGDERGAKKQRTMGCSPSVHAKESLQSPLKRRFGNGSKIPRKGLTLGRLNMLASPKKRR